MRRRISYFFLSICWLLLSCGNFKRATTLHFPEGLDSNFRSSPVKFGSSKRSYAIQVLEFKAFSDTLVSSEYRDSMLTYGIVLPASSLIASASAKKMIFGTDSVRCSIHYITLDIYKSEEQSSFLLDILLPPDRKSQVFPKPEDGGS